MYGYFLTVIIKCVNSSLVFSYTLSHFILKTTQLNIYFSVYCTKEEMKLKNITLDLHNSNFEGNIMTEYEQLFSEKGQPIYRCEASFCGEHIAARSKELSVSATEK